MLLLESSLAAKCRPARWKPLRMCIPTAPLAKTIAKSNDMAAATNAYGILPKIPQRVNAVTKVVKRLSAPLPTRNRVIASVKFDGN